MDFTLGDMCPTHMPPNGPSDKVLILEALHVPWIFAMDEIKYPEVHVTLRSAKAQML